MTVQRFKLGNVAFLIAFLVPQSTFSNLNFDLLQKKNKKNSTIYFFNHEDEEDYSNKSYKAWNSHLCYYPQIDCIKVNLASQMLICKL